MILFQSGFFLLSLSLGRPLSLWESLLSVWEGLFYDTEGLFYM